MGVPDNTLLDLIEKVRSWIYWGRSDLTTSSIEIKMADGVSSMCCQCEMRVSESYLGYHCRKCNRLFCESCVQGYGSFVVVESKSGTQAGLDIRSCKFCVDFDDKQKFGGKFSHKIHPSDSPRQSPEPPSPNYVYERFDGTSLQAVSVRRSLSRSDEDEAEDSSKNIFSPYSRDTSDIDSSSLNTRNEFYSFMSVGSSPSDSPSSRIHFTSNRRRHSVQLEDHGTPRSLNDGSFDQEPVAVLKSHQNGTEEEPDNNTTNDDLSIFRNQYEKPLDLENNGLIWFPLPPDDEETSFFSYADDDDDDEMGATTAVFTSSDPLMSVVPENVEHKKPLETVVQGHFRALVSQLLQSEFTAADEWLDIITSLAWQAANYVKPDTSRGGSMDPGDYVKIKCIASGSPNESMFVKGVVCTKNIKHKRMTSQYKNPRLLILGGALEYQRSHNQLASIETLLQQEIDHLKMIVSRIEARRPNVLLVEKSVSSYAQEYLLAKEISLVSNVKRSLLERIARCTGTPITPSVDKISTTRLGQCELFRLEKFSEVHEAANLSTKKPSKTLMFFDGCPRRLGCTVLLKGLRREELKKVKHVVQYAVFAAYHLSLETSFLADEGASLPKTTVKPSIAVPERSNADNAISAISSSTLLSPSEVSNSPRFDGHDLVVDHQNSDLITDGSFHTVSDPLDGNGGLECSRENPEEMTSIESTEVEKVERLEVTDGSNNSNEYYSATDTNQSILVSFSSRCVLNGNVCERSRLLRIKFYGCFDKPLGRYLQDDLFDQASLCRSCNEAAESHVICYTHQQGNLTINVRRLPSLKLPGEKDGKIWMWHRCLRCAHVDGVPPATHRVVMSDAAWGLSFGKFLELSFSNHATANRIAGCGHSLQRDCLRFYGLGSMVVFFRYSPIDILSVRLPPSVLEFSGHVQQDWLKKDVSELLSKTEGLYDEILDVLHRTEQKSISDCDGILDSGELSKHVKELKEMLIKERNVYIDLLQPCGEESVEDRRAEIDVFELNRLRHSLMIGLHVWDRRVSSLNSIYSSKPTYDTGSKVEVKHRRCFSTFEHTVDHSRSADDSDLNQIEETDGSPRDIEESESIPSDQFEDGHISAASFLSDKIDSAWAGPLRVSSPSHNSPIEKNQHLNPHFRRLTSTPARVYSFDSAITLQERFTKELPFSTLRSFQDPICSIHRSYSQVFPGGDPKSEFLKGTKPMFISATSFLPEGARLMGGQNAVIAVYDNEPTSIISYALASKEYEEWFTDKPHLNRNNSVASKLSAWQSFGSLDLDYVQYGNYGSEDPSFSDAKSTHHLTIPFEDESGPGGKVKFSVTCYFAKQFDALRKKCCPSEVDYMRSLSRCKRWSAQGGKSNVYFAKSLDERFIIKQVTKTELESFEEFAPQYFKYLTDSLNSGSPTCLAKIVGIYQVTVKHLKGGKEAKMHVMVMENLFYKRNISRIYDLKGSARSRYNSDMTGTNKTLLDMNLLEALRTKPLFLGSKAKRSLERAVWNDTSFLASIDVMDYSLLVGVDEESKELVLGIIDFMRQYTWDKQLETWVKASGILGGPKNAPPTIISPKQYKRRFRKAMTSYFLTVPDQWSS